MNTVVASMNATLDFIRLSLDQIENRNSGLGASDAPAALGLSPWKTPLELYLEKIGEGPEREYTLPMQVGHALEPVVLQLLADQRGIEITRRQERVIDLSHGWRWVTLDGMTPDGVLIEAKTAGSKDGWGEEGTDQIPTPYIVQVQHGLACTGAERALVPVLFFARDFRVYEVARDDALIEGITERERAFMERVWRREPPEPVTMADLAVYYRDAGTSVEADTADLKRIHRLRRIRDLIEKLGAKRDELTAELMRRLGDASTLVDPDGKPLVTWKEQNGRATIDSKKLATEYPDILPLVQKQGKPFRVFRLK